jgi:hypothetical protein
MVKVFSLQLDLDNSLGFGGNTFELLDTNIFLAHLDDAASFTVDDDDEDSKPLTRPSQPRYLRSLLTWHCSKPQKREILW